MFGRMWKDRNFDDRVRVEILLRGQDFLILIGGMLDSLTIDSRMWNEKQNITSYRHFA